MVDAQKSLRVRFEEFVTTLEGFESVDELLKNDAREGIKRADYLFSGRSIIVEQKSIETDPYNKPQEFIDDLVQKGRIIFWGTLSTDYLLSKLPDRDKLKAEMFDRITRQIDTAVARADKQTRDTREVLEIPTAMGVLILLNENAKTLTPDIIRYGLQRPFAKRLQDGSLRYPNNTGVIVISEAHSQDGLGGEKSCVFLQMSHPGLLRENVFEPFYRWLSERWIVFNNNQHNCDWQRPTGL